MMEPLVSILIPAYNAEHWIGETLDCALGQTWPNKEVVVVDDGSTDGTLAVAREYGGEGVTVVTQENQGGCVARNKAFSLCRGDYIQWLDADDILAPDKIERQMDARQENDDDWVMLSGPWGHFFFHPDKVEYRRDSLWCDLSPVEWMIRKLSENVFMTNSAWLVSRKLTEEAGPWDERLHKDQDGEYFARVMAASHAVRFVPDAWMYYRRSSADSTSIIGGSPRKLESQFLSMKLQMQYLRDIEESERVREACLAFLQTWYFHFFPECSGIVREMEAMAADLGGEMTLPELGWKYDWIRRTCGWGPAKRAQESYNRAKFGLLRRWEKACDMLAPDRSGRTDTRQVGCAACGPEKRTGVDDE